MWERFPALHIIGHSTMKDGERKGFLKWHKEQDGEFDFHLDRYRCYAITSSKSSENNRQYFLIQKPLVFLIVQIISDHHQTRLW